jgi:EAL domain-containing protein (putative c-di-GMP-specific phosphodiesterase class I)
VLAALGGGAADADGEVVRFDANDDALDGLLERIAAAVTPAERAAIRALVAPAASEPGVAAYLHAVSLDGLLAQRRSGWLVDALETDSVRSFFQPIYDAQNGSLFAHEALLRVERDGRYYGPGDAFRVASDADLAQFLDRVARETAIASAAATGLQGNLFINFLPSAIYDPNTCLATTVAALERSGIAHERVVFEVVESDRVHDPAHLRAIVDYYRASGFRIALDDLGAGYSSFNLVHHLHPDFVKLDMSLIRDVHRDEYKAVLAGKLVDAAHDLGIGVVAEGIERAEELAWVRARGVEYAQGYFLGKPAEAPVSV